MAFTLVSNPGSSSKKYAFYDGDRCVYSVRFEATPDGYEQCVERNGEQQVCEGVELGKFQRAVPAAVALATAAGTIAGPVDITAVGVRIVAPGTYFTEHRLIGPEYIEHLQNCSPLAPLHVPMLLREIAGLQETLPDRPLYGVSDSAFHATRPPIARSYALPSADVAAYDIHRFGYHGLSVASVARRLPTVFGEVPARTIVCHVGSGMSITALRDGRSIETSMNYSPESGLIMGTRSGDVDAGALLALMHEKRLLPFDAHVYLSTQGGLKGLIGNNDFRYALERHAHGEQAATDALALLAYQFKKVIGASVAALQGLDAVVLTATAVVRNSDIRRLLLSDLSVFGIELAAQRNHDLIGKEGFIHANQSPVKIAVLKTDEMGEINRVVHEATAPLADL